MSEPALRPSSRVTVFRSRTRNLHIVYGIITLIAVTILAVGNLVDDPQMDDRTQVGLTVVWGSIAVILVAAWIYEVRHPLRLEISPESIVQQRRGRRKQQIVRGTTDELHVLIPQTPGAGLVLTTPGGSERIRLLRWGLDDIKPACEAAGWRLIEK
ncbi:MAG TPA: hypothetical protein VNC78_10575 [Actinomycetota bacterium]|nr:hypothetical protein [Actinomycetota bacterium]